MKIALGQMEVIAGYPSINFERMEQLVNEAVAQQADLIVFPELCLSGYLLQDKWLDDLWVKSIESYNDKVLKLSEKIAIIWGNVKTIPGISGRDGRTSRINSAFFAYKGKYLKRENDKFPGWYVKHLNPDYRMFNDSRYFLSALELYQHQEFCDGDFLSPFLMKLGDKTYRIGLQVCEDMFSNDYALDITDRYHQQAVDIIVNVSASPYTKGKEQARLKSLTKNQYQGYFVYCNAVSCQNTGKNVIVFDGNSMIINHQQIVLQATDDFTQQCVIEQKEIKVSTQVAKLYNMLVYALRSFDQQIFNQRVNWIIGLSGGLDSSLSAALCVAAFGSTRVKGYYMQSKYSSTTTKNNARQLAETLNIDFKETNIELLVAATNETLATCDYHDSPSLVQENIQARIRGHLLSTFAALENGVVVNNGNKVENALGYATLYGDAIGAIAPLGDLLKIELFDLAHEINQRNQKTIIPTCLLPVVQNDQLYFEFPPSAELKNNQQDPMKWYYHDWLIDYLMTYPNYRMEKLMEAYLTGEIYQWSVGRWLKHYGLDQPQKFVDDLMWVLNLMNKNVFKRVQSPPNILYSRGAFGNDFLECQGSFEKTQLMVELIDKIKSMG